MDAGVGRPEMGSRNAQCPCGSGKRFKHCCGAEAAPPLQTRFAALAAHRAGRLGRAESLYRQALEEDPRDVDALHMLGVVQLERMRFREALDILWDAAEATAWAVPSIRHNIGLVLGKLLARETNARQTALLECFVAQERGRASGKTGVSPLVSVVLPAFNHARFVREAIASVAAQTYPHIELVVIDDGSIDGTGAIAKAATEGLALPSKVISRENRGAPATLNEGAALARGTYLAFLNSDDCYAPDRIACMVDEIAATGARWGFSLVRSMIGESGASLTTRAGTCRIQQKQRSFLGTQSNSFTVVEYNVAVSSGNLFVERDFFHSVGGFRNFRYNHDWDFCLRAAGLEEPVVVHRPLYLYRIHEHNTISESKQRTIEEADRIFADFLAGALAGRVDSGNDLAPQAPGNRDLLLRVAFRAGQGALVPVDKLRALALEWRMKARPAMPVDDPAVAAGSGVGTAIVVLGMHRSGTSALSRVLNLCGAFLPSKLKPPKLGVNPKGYWEPEAVLDLNVRLMRQLGGDWDRVDFDLPADGDVVAEFEDDARALLAAEYGDQPMILIKDPRIGVLAPLWHRALQRAGYRPVYVVPVRNPVEVAQSLQARGDMSVDEGLALWLAYSRRITAFTDSGCDAVYVRYTDLLDDWRRIVHRIGERLDLPLDPVTRAEDVDRFLERGLQRQNADGDTLEALSSGLPIAGEVRDLYGGCLARCDSAVPRVCAPAAGATSGTVTRAGSPPGSAPSASFVLCIEGNAIRDQALLLCRSIRRFGGRYRDAAILAYAPRPGLGVDRDARIALEELEVEYIDAPLNTTCLDYAPANRVFAGAHAEAHVDTEFLVVLDSDTVWLGEPEMPGDADAAVRPVDLKGSATRGPGDRFEAYWAALARFCGVSLDCLPAVTTTISNERIRASYNGGFAIVRRSRGILTRCAEIFGASVRAGTRPYLGTGIEIVASTGNVGTAGSEYWGSSQTALALAIWSATDRVQHYPDHYNLPLHLVAAEGEIDPRWFARSPVHVHYHWMFGRRRCDVALELLARLGVPGDRCAWLAGRTPLREVPARNPRRQAEAA
ncbi:MAG TPA: glycosyltransferase [Casimicrobiaceae bacterium]|nr:glycosyltransferase [Casimicrobiaceae bacterium]